MASVGAMILMLVAALPALADAPQVARVPRRVSVDVGGRVMSLLVTDGTEPTVLLEAGMGQDATEWAAVQARLARCIPCRIVSYDRAGFGASAHEHVAYDIEREVASLVVALERIGAHYNVIYVAHSYGAFLAQVYALRHPDRLRGLVLVDPNTVAFNDGGGVEALWPPRSWNEVPPGDMRVVQAYPATLAYLRKLPAFTTVAAPVVVITAGQQWLPTVELAALWRHCHELLVKDWRHRALRVAEQSGHMIPIDQPDLICQAVVDVLAGLPPLRK